MANLASEPKGRALAKTLPRRRFHHFWPSRNPELDSTDSVPGAHAEGTRDAEGTYGAPAYWQSEQVQAPSCFEAFYNFMLWLPHSRKPVPVPVARERLAAERQYRGAAGPRDQLQQRLQLLPNPNPNRQPLPWQEVKQPEVPAYTQSNSWQEGKQVPACVQSGWPLFSDTGEDADPKA